MVDGVRRLALTSPAMFTAARTRSRIARLWAVCALGHVAGLGFAQTVAAQAPAAQPVAAAAAPSVEVARDAYARGQAAFAHGDFATAQTAFEQAFANVPNPIVLVSIAESAAKQGKIESALRAYDQYLSLRPTAPDRADVELKRAALAQTPGEVLVTSEPAGADILVDDRAVGQRTPAAVEISPGAHRIQVVLSGYASEPAQVTVSAGAHTQQVLALHEEQPHVAETTPAQPAAEPAPAAATESSSSPTAAIVVTASLGAAGLIAGTALGILALNARSDYDQNPTAAKADDGERLALFSDVGFGIGAMALVTTAVLLFTHEPASSTDSDKTQRASLQLIPHVTPSGASATAKLRF